MRSCHLYKEVLAIGADHYNTLWLVRALGMAGFEPTAIIIGKKETRSFVGKSKYCKKCYCLLSMDELLPLLDRFNFPQRTVLIAASDKVAKLIDLNYCHLSTKFILCNCDQKEGGICHWMNKKEQLACAKDSGLPIPFSKTYDLGIDYIFNEVKYPALVKPEISANASKNSFRICHNEFELRKAIDEIKGTCSRVIVQEYVQHDNEYLMYGVSMGNEIIIPGGLFKTMTCSDTQNLGMHVYGYISAHHPSQFDGIEAVKRFVKNICYQGIFSVEVMITKEHYYFLEINLRNDGTSFFTTQAGVNIPAIWTAYCYGYDMKEYPITFKRERTYGLNEINYIKYGLKQNGIVGTIKNVLRAKAFSLYKYNDIKPLLFKLLYH